MPLDDVPCLELEVVRPPSRRTGGNYGGGARRKLDARRFVRICHLIEAGQSHPDACKVEGVGYSIFRKRVNEQRSWHKRLSKANKIRFELRYEWHLANVTQAAADDPRLSIAFLDRCQGWATPPGSPILTGRAVLPDLSVEAKEHLAELAKAITKVAIAQAMQEPPEPPPPNNVIDIEASQTGTND